MKFIIAVLILVTSLAPSAFAWNALGHKVVAAIAWQRITPEKRAEIVALLRRHPRFDEAFAKRLYEPGDPDPLIFLPASP